MKTSLLCVLLFCLSQNAFGQLSGKLTTASGDPVPFANVLVLNASDTSFIKGTIANEQGEYEIDKIKTGNYFLRYSAVGFETYNSPAFALTASQGRKNFGAVVLKEDTQLLEEVVVQAEKPLYQQEIDRTVVNVQASVLTKGSSALEVLERSPGIYIDRQNSNISLNGKNGVMVMVNGKLMRLPLSQVVTMLNGMSANNIEKIELLTTPPSKYDAEGSAGMINIVLKKSEELGTNGSFSITGGYGKGEKGAGSVNLSRSTGKFNTYGSYTFSRDRTLSGWDAESTQNMPAMGGYLSTYFSNKAKAVYTNHNATVGVDVNLSKATIGGSVAYNSSLVANDIFNHAEYTILQPDSFILMKANIQGTNRWRNMISTVYLEKEISEGEKINVDVDYLYYDNESPTDAYSSFVDRAGNEIAPGGSIFSTRQKGSAHTPIQVGVFKIDYAKQLNKKLKIEAGVKGAYTRSSSLSTIASLVNDEWVSSPRTSNDIHMRESIEAAYASFHWDLSPSATLSAGTRYEYSHTHLDATRKENNIDRKISKLFPSVFFSKKLTDKAEVQLSYTKRISRPSYNDLASYMLYTDPMSVFTGNPALRPTITHNLKAGYNYDGYSFSILLSKDEYPIARYQLTESPASDLMYVAPQNMQYQNSLAFQTTLPWKINSWWSVTIGFTGSLQQFKLKHTKEKIIKTYFVYPINVSQTFKLPKSFFVEISGWYTSQFYNGSNKVDGFGVLNAGIKKELKNNKGSIQLSVSDLFKSLSISSYFGHLTEEAFSLRSHVIYKAESARARIIKFTYSRSFGNTKAKSERRGTGSKDEMDRIRKE